jgi:hypothetical protein
MLTYDESPSGAKPEQLRPPEISQSLLAQYQEARQDLMAVTGIYDVSMGNQGDVMSGKASDSQIKRGSLNTEVSRNSLNLAIEVSGMIVNEMIPEVYDSQRTETLNLPHAGQQKVTLNRQLDQYGGGVQNDMTTGKYKIRLVPGQSYEGQKSENLEFLEMLLQAQPQLFNLIADLIVDNSPMANPIELRNRLRALVPPEILEAGKTGKPPPPKPPTPDPMVELKKQELQQKMESEQLKFQHQMAALQQKREQMIIDAHKSGADLTVSLQKLQSEKEVLEEQMQENMRRYQAEMSRIRLDANKHHSEQVLKVLTHEPKHLEEKDNAGTKPTAA